MKVTEGFQSADNRNLPSVSYLMIMEYMYENDCYNAVETRCAKALLASRESYVETAVGYVEVKREANLCIIKCRVTPEYNVKGKLYVVSATIDETAEKIIKVECNDCAAAAGGCKHAICFVIWLVKRSDEPSVTSTVCYWTKPRLAAAVTDKQFVLAKNLGRKRKVPEDINVNVTLSTFTNECNLRNISEGMILKYCQEQQPALIDLNHGMQTSLQTTSKTK
ncbi:unnamed protein product [Colias eurytheme]|nr:unnamed protein product [Colias eurytheme]